MTERKRLLQIKKIRLKDKKKLTCNTGKSKKGGLFFGAYTQLLVSVRVVLFQISPPLFLSLAHLLILPFFVVFW
jgi:hypothetical protein